MLLNRAQDCDSHANWIYNTFDYGKNGLKGFTLPVLEKDMNGFC